MTTGSQLERVDCPACPARFHIEDLLPVAQIRCPGCGTEWLVKLQDAPGGRFLIDLLPLGSA
jgi:DNA-directed RNA polymerase subunit RPC12/RpoP